MEILIDYFLVFKITVDPDCTHEIKRLALWMKSYEDTRQHIKNLRYHSVDKDPYSQSYGFSSSHIWMWELDHKDGQVTELNWIELKHHYEQTVEVMEFQLSYFKS